MRGLWPLVLLASPAAADPAIPRFVPETGGISHIFTGEWEFMVGGGVAVFDCNGDDRCNICSNVVFIPNSR
jgi:hypothetical protein